MTGRPRSFDEAEVLERAMDLFWERGYEATGLSELTSAMGIGRQSLYSTFGDKKQLFMRALDHYLETGLAEIREAFEAQSSPLQRLRSWLELKIEGVCTASAAGRGCFAVNSIVELCPDHPDVVGQMQGHFQRITALMAETVALGQVRGEIRPDREPEALAQFVMTGGGGLIVASKLQLPPEVGAASIELILDAIAIQGS